MKPWLAIMAWDGNNRVAKLADFATQAEALAHVAAFAARFPNAFAVATPGSGNTQDWVVAGTSLLVQPIPPRSADQLAADFLDAADNKLLRLLFERDFNRENRLLALEGQPPVTRAQHRAALINVVKSL